MDPVGWPWGGSEGRRQGCSYGAGLAEVGGWLPSCREGQALMLWGLQCLRVLFFSDGLCVTDEVGSEEWGSKGWAGPWLLLGPDGQFSAPTARTRGSEGFGTDWLKCSLSQWAPWDLAPLFLHDFVYFTEQFTISSSLRCCLKGGSHFLLHLSARHPQHAQAQPKIMEWPTWLN